MILSPWQPRMISKACWERKGTWPNEKERKENDFVETALSASAAQGDVKRKASQKEPTDASMWLAGGME